LRYGQFSFLGPRPQHTRVRARFRPQILKLNINIFIGHEAGRQNISKPSNMSIDSTESIPTRSETTHDHMAQSRPDLDHNALVETITESNTPSLLSGLSRTHSITSVRSSASSGKSANPFLYSATEFTFASPSLETNCYRAISPYLYPSPLEWGDFPSLELGDFLSDWSQCFAASFWDDSQVYAPLFYMYFKVRGLL
jgi:hypothetical protein